MNRLTKMISLVEPAKLSAASLAAIVAFAVLVTACRPPVTANVFGSSSSPDRSTLVVYSGRNENLIAPLIERFTGETGIEVEVRYGDTAEMAATILEEGRNSPADVFFGQDAGTLGALADAGRLQPLSGDLLTRVPARFRSNDGYWVGVSGRARVLVYNTELVPDSRLPQDVWELTQEEWRGKVGWAPTNGSFQSFVTAMRVVDGEQRALEWLKAMLANDVQSYPNNSAIVDATASGEISLGLVNHYYLYRFLAENGAGFPARNYHFPTQGAESMVNVAGVGIVDTSDNPDAALEFVEFLLSPEAQRYFAQETNEYPLIDISVPLAYDLPPLSSLQGPAMDLAGLDDLEGTLTLLQEAGALD